MNFDVILIRYGELSLKSTYVRKLFESTLIRNIKRVHDQEDIIHTLRRERGRIYLTTADIPASITLLSRIFGIVSFSSAVETDATMEAISHSALQLVKNILSEEKSFAIRSTRVGNHPFTSNDVAVRIGKDIVDATHAKVDLTSPDFELFIEIRDKKSFLFTEKIRGVGGLPLGTQGRILTLVENPYSLLAAWFLMRRGCNVVFLNTKESNEESIKSFLTYWFAEAESIFFNPADEAFYKNLSIIATEKKCDALITGHTLDDPMSTFSDLTRFKKEIALPVLTPLISMTKEDIQRDCRKRGIVT
jgi:thiamine biosynthesis protein ThiI